MERDSDWDEQDGLQSLLSQRRALEVLDGSDVTSTGGSLVRNKTKRRFSLSGRKETRDSKTGRTAGYWMGA